MEKYAVPNKLPAKQVSILAHRKRRVEQKSVNLRKVHKKFNKGDVQHFKKPEYFVSEFRKAERDDKRITREIMRHGLDRKYMKDGALIVALRHRGTHIASDQCITILNQLKLRRLHQAVFLRFTPETKALLSLIEPYVIYGCPNITTVRDLIFKYGFIKYKGKKTPISSNTKIEEVFGEQGIICLEDIIHEIFTCGPAFVKVQSSLIPFTLPNPKEGWTGKKGLSFQKGGTAGYRGEHVNEFLKTIL